MESRHLIVGEGEIGQSVHTVLMNDFDVQIRDKESSVVGQFNYLHIAFPYDENFLSEVERYDYMYSPRTIIVHSTVPVGTIRQLGEKAVHVPIRGRHPNLAPAIRTFRLYVGGVDIERIKDVAALFGQVCEDVYILNYPPETTEILKLMSTSQYGWHILFAKEMRRICDEYNVPFEVLYTDATKSYNKGYEKLGEKQFVRPVLEDMPGKIGGHCVVQNAELFQDTYINQIIVEKNNEFRSTDV
jgi:hypothetical protein